MIEVQYQVQSRSRQQGHSTSCTVRIVGPRTLGWDGPGRRVRGRGRGRARGSFFRGHSEAHPGRRPESRVHTVVAAQVHSVR